MKFKNVVKVHIPEGVTEIGKYAFDGCAALEEITLPQSLTSVGDRAFRGCSNLSLTTYNYGNYLGNSENKYLYLHSVSNTSVKSLTVHSETVIIGSDALNGCSNLEDMTLYSGVKQMCYMSIIGADNLKEIGFYGADYQWNSIRKDNTVTNFISNNGITVKYLEQN